ncbi:hypothetical protein ACFQVA_24750 [Actinomadura keratinilytica]
MRGQVGHADPVEPEQGVGEPGRETAGQARRALGGPAEGGAAQQVRGSADGQADPGRTPSARSAARSQPVAPAPTTRMSWPS